MAIISVIATVLIKKPNCTLQVGHYNAYQYRCLCMFNANEVKPMTNHLGGGFLNPFMLILGMVTGWFSIGFTSLPHHGITITGWWFGTFFIFPYIGNNHPN